jgi:multidrug efflux system membrane fusion protein
MRLPLSRCSGACLIGLSIALAGCSDKTRAESAAASASPRQARAGGAAVPVLVAQVVQKAMPLELRVIGNVEASQTVAIRAQITGELTSVSFKEGDDVQQGQVLFALDRRPLEAALKQAEANLARDLAQSEGAAQQARRVQDLAGRGIATREQVDTSQTAATALEATVGADRAAIESATVQLQYATMRAPIAGRTGALMVHPGNLVRAGDATPLVVINQVAPVWVAFGIPEGQLPVLKRHMAQGPLRVEARPPADDQHGSVGTVTFVDNQVDLTTGNIKIKGTFQNTDRRLWPGQFVNVVVILTQEPNAIVVPTVAVQTAQQGSYVYAVKEDQTVEMRPIEVARTSGPETIVAKGLKPGETVVTDGQLRLVPGSRITIKSSSNQATDQKVAQ